MATLKPTTPLHVPEQQPLKPPSPLHPKTAPKQPISHPQRRWRFQSRLGRHPQRRWRFQTGPPGRQGQAAPPMGGGGAWPGDQWAADVTNVVNLSPKTTIFSEKALGLTTFVTTDQKSTRKTPWIDDVCNNTHQSTPKTQHARPLRRPQETAGPGRASRRRAEPDISDPTPLVWRAPKGLVGQAAVPVGGGGAWPGFGTTHQSTRQQRRRRRCGGRRRDRRARAGFEARRRTK